LDVMLGVGPVLATALVASIGDRKAFRSGRDFRPGSGRTEAEFERRQSQARQHQQTRRSLSRNLFTAGTLAVIRYAKLHGTEPMACGIGGAAADAAIALANKIARMAWAIMTKRGARKNPSH
ncbi:MAG: transposase, partial [Bradyrhizobium sp.]|nr:transposase [Bradyrhizobium sp.]